ncbi:coiled-coil domain-containing protein 14 isoform X2 [Hyperolius riggenbachi]|uniref:coiled-coil domain-containing protein 14 isoform X2 n=1 Tax=Hyperolius riggenbachi TaxID=752182 RepID=UPI0035A26D5E
MAGARGAQVFSSGRIPPNVRPRSCKKRAAVRKLSAPSVDSGYSLCSTDSEDQVLVINKGLDRCAALLQDILQCDGRDNAVKTHKAPFPRAPVRTAEKGKKGGTRKPPATSHPAKEKGSESAVLFNCRLPTSTPTLSPHHPATTQDVGCEVHYQSLPPGGAAHFPSAAASMAQSVPAAYSSAQAPVQPLPSAPSSGQVDVPAQIGGYKFRDSDLLQCLAAHLAQLQRSDNTGKEPAYPSEPERRTTETEETSSEEEAGTARDISCQTSFTSQKRSPERTERKIRTVKYLLGEIQALVADTGDGEALRLLSELEHSVSLLPAVVGSTNVQAEIALALQPLRSENAQLRRRLRILNQQLRDRERAARCDDDDYELTSVQSMNEALQQQLLESRRSLESLQNKTDELLKVADNQKEENQKLSQALQEKEEEILRIRQENIASSRLRTDTDDALGKVKSVQFKLETSEKENQILRITLRQRDAEVSRLRELTRTLQSSMAKLLCDLGKDGTTPRPGAPLTQATLDSYEKQLSSDQCPASTSIISYLKRLEMDQVIPSPGEEADPRATLSNGLPSDPSNEVTPSKGPMTYQRPESTITSIPPYSPQKVRTEVNSESCYGMEDEYKPDETTYLPLASSPRKANLMPPLRVMCSPPKVCSAERDVGGSVSCAKTNAFNSSRIQRSLFNGPDLDLPSKIKEPQMPPAKDPSRNPLPLFQHIKNLQVGDNHLTDQSLCDVTSGRSDWSIASFSTFTSHDEQDFRNGLATLDANIAKLQRTLQSSSRK